MSDPTAPLVLFDFEFCFRTSGVKEYFSAQDGRDKIAIDDARMRLELHPDPQTIDEIIIQRAELAYMRTTKRTVAPEATIEDAGRLRLVGADA